MELSTVQYETQYRDAYSAVSWWGQSNVPRVHYKHEEHEYSSSQHYNSWYNERPSPSVIISITVCPEWGDNGAQNIAYWGVRVPDAHDETTAVRGGGRRGEEGGERGGGGNGVNSWWILQQRYSVSVLEMDPYGYLQVACKLHN